MWYDDPITSFSGEYRWLSNFAPKEILWQNIKYPTVEHAYQAAKLHESCVTGRLMIANADTPGQAKRMGQKLILESWWTTEYRLKTMEELLRQKFGYGPNEYFDKLVATGDRWIEEGNTWGDEFWGTCNGKGFNHLGKLLMKIRKDMQKIDEELRNSR